VHVSELSWKHVDHPSSVVAVGDEVTVQVLDVDLDKERISLSLKATQVDPWQEFATNHRIGELVYGRITKLVPFGAFVQVGDGIEGLVHISEMAAHHVDLPEQVVTPGEELWVKIIDIDLQRRRISLSIKQAAEGGEVAEEYREAFGEHAYDDQGNYIGYDYSASEFTPDNESQAAWADLLAANEAASAAAAAAAGEAPGAQAEHVSEEGAGASAPAPRQPATATEEATAQPEAAQQPAQPEAATQLDAGAEPKSAIPAQGAAQAETAAGVETAAETAGEPPAAAGQGAPETPPSHGAPEA
jgi:small subunit ribosomal protein S1